jgi:aromatic-L-amino-acid decarboxylase
MPWAPKNAYRSHLTSLSEMRGGLDDPVAALEPGFDSAGGGVLSYIPWGALLVAGLASYLGAITNRYIGANHSAPGMVALEQGVIDWMVELFGRPSSANNS